MYTYGELISSPIIKKKKNTKWVDKYVLVLQVFEPKFGEKDFMTWW